LAIRQIPELRLASVDAVEYLLDLLERTPIPRVPVGKACSVVDAHPSFLVVETLEEVAYLAVVAVGMVEA
jgi:hypothetical protein